MKSCPSATATKIQARTLCCITVICIQQSYHSTRLTPWPHSPVLPIASGVSTCLRQGESTSRRRHSALPPMLTTNTPSGFVLVFGGGPLPFFIFIVLVVCSACTSRPTIWKMKPLGVTKDREDDTAEKYEGFTSMMTTAEEKSFQVLIWYCFLELVLVDRSHRHSVLRWTQDFAALCWLILSHRHTYSFAIGTYLGR